MSIPTADVPITPRADKNVRILLIEEERVTAQSVQRQLRNLGFQVIGLAKRGEEAVRLAEKLRPTSSSSTFNWTT